MANYTIFPDDDKQQVGGGAITATSTIIDGGTAAALGVALPTDTVLTAELQLGGRAAVHGSQVVQQKDVFGAFHGTPATATAVDDDTNGFCDFTDTSHGLSVGDVVSVSGSTTGNVDGVHVITSLPDANSFVTNRPFVTSATAGDYTLVQGRCASMTAGTWLIQGYTMVPAEQAGTFPAYGKSGITNSIHRMLHMRSRLVATAIRAGFWDIFSGVFTTAPTVQDDHAGGAGTWGTDDAANPTRPIPGELVYRTSGQQDGSTGFGVTEDDYEAKTG